MASEDNIFFKITATQNYEDEDNDNELNLLSNIIKLKIKDDTKENGDKMKIKNWLDKKIEEHNKKIHNFSHETNGCVFYEDKDNFINEIIFHFKNNYIGEGFPNNSWLESVLDRNTWMKFTKEAYLKNIKVFEELEKADMSAKAFIDKQGYSQLIEMPVRDFDFSKDGQEDIGTCSYINFKEISVFKFLRILSYFASSKKGVFEKILPINFVNNVVSNLNNSLNKEFEEIEKVIALYDDEDIPLDTYVNDNLNNFTLLNVLYQHLLSTNFYYADISILEIIKYLKENVKIATTKKVLTTKEKRSFITLPYDKIKSSSVMDFAYDTHLELNDVAISNGITISQTSLNNIREDIVFLGNKILDEFNIALYTGNIEEHFFPNIKNPYLVKKWYSMGDFKKLESTLNENNKDFVKLMLNKIKKKQLINIQLINNQRDNLKELKKDFPNFTDVIKFIDDYLAIQEKTTGEFYFPPILLDGPPGIGKTFFLTRLAQIFDVEYHIENMASVTTGARFTGTEQHWSNANIGLLMTSILTWRYANGIILLDEIDKVRSDNHNGPSPIITLLPLLERKTSEKMLDVSLDLPFDARHFIWTASSNNTDKIHPALLSRFNVFKIKSPSESERKILTQAIYKQLLIDNDWNKFFDSELPEDTLNKIVSELDGGSARQTKRIIQEALAKAAADNSSIIKVEHLTDRSIQYRRIGFN